MMRATARAQINIALVKYWGKRDAELNLPQAGSLSLTLDGLGSITTVRFDEALPADTLAIDGAAQQGPALRKARHVLDAIRERAGLLARACVSSENSVPTGAGLASSASGLAALTRAAASAAGLALSLEELSAIARRGSGSACRSIFGGFAEWIAGQRADGKDSHARPLFAPEHWDLRVMVAVLARQQKKVPSSEGMEHTRHTSPYHARFVESVPADLEAAKAAIAARDITALGRVAERSCLRMHADMLAADPPLCYLQPASWELFDGVRALREAGTPAFFSADAGPNVKVFCAAASAPRVRALLEAHEGVQSVISCRPGLGASLVEDAP